MLFRNDKRLSDPLLIRIARMLAQGFHEPDPDLELDTAMMALVITATENGWHYVAFICLQHIRQTNPKLFEELYHDVGEDVIVQILVANHRVNEALEFHFQGDPTGAAPPVEAVRLPSRQWNFSKTDKWVTGETVRSMLATIRDDARKKPTRTTEAWAAKQVLQECKRLNVHMHHASLMQLQRHAMALNELQWRRLTQHSMKRALHLRIHYSTALLKVSVRVGDVSTSKTSLYIRDIVPALSPEDRRVADRDTGLRFLSHFAFQLISRLADRAPMETIMPLLRSVYDSLLGDILSQDDVAREIERLGPMPPMVVATHGVLAQLPFAALHDGDTHLIEKYNIIMAPPVFSEEPFKPGDMDYEAVTGGMAIRHRALRVMADMSGDSLAHTGHEIKRYKEISVETGMPVDILPGDVGSKWNADSLRWLLATPGIAILSSHILHSSISPARTSIMTPDKESLAFGALTDAAIQADLVILAGCVSANTIDWFGPDESSLVSFLRRKGAQSVVATLWPIHDFSARKYNEALVEALAGGASRAVAHGTAIRSLMTMQASLGQLKGGERLIRQTSPENSEVKQNLLNLSHPYYWSGFVMYGASL